MNKLTKIERFFKETNFSADDELFVGVDVHKKSYHVALYLNDAPSIDFVMPANKKQLSQTLKPTSSALKRVAYEAGFSGYGLARCLKKDHLPVSIAATSKIPRPSAADDKTDKLDSKKLAEYAAKGLLKPVAIPTPQTGSGPPTLPGASSTVTESGQSQSPNQILPADA